MDATVNALAVSGPDLYAGGWFTAAGATTVNHIAKWDGGAWSALGSGMNERVLALAVSGTDLYAGGLSIMGGVLAGTSRIAKWDGSVWSALGSDMSGIVYALAVSGTDLYAGGRFTTAGGVAANRIAKWDGSTWAALGSGMDDDVYALAADSSGHLFVGGVFSNAGRTVSPYVVQANLHSASPAFAAAVGIQSSGADFTLTFTGAPAAVYRVQYQLDQLNAGQLASGWTDLDPLHTADDEGGFRHTDAGPTNWARFYRAVKVP